MNPASAGFFFARFLNPAAAGTIPNAFGLAPDG
jgi:hypothetical protein